MKTDLDFLLKTILITATCCLPFACTHRERS